MYLTTRGLVLRETKYKEADKMLTVLTEDEGKLSLRARGVLQKSSKLAASAGLLCFSEMTLFGNRGRWTLEEATVVEHFAGLREDLELFALGSYFAELLESVSDEDSPNAGILYLGLNALYALSRGLHEPALVKAAFELRMLGISGYAPDLDCCALCGGEETERPVLDLAGGTLLCSHCAGSDMREGASLCAASLSAMRYILSSENKRIFSFAISGDAQTRLYAACERYVQCQLDRGFKTLDYYRQVKG